MHEIAIPFGVNVLWDPIQSLNLAMATGAKFIREIISGVYASDFGLWNTNVGATVRHQYAIGAESVKLLYNIVPEAARYLADRDIVSIARSTVFNNKSDALCVSGLTAGAETDSQILQQSRALFPIPSCSPIPVCGWRTWKNNSASLMVQWSAPPLRKTGFSRMPWMLPVLNNSWTKLKHSVSKYVSGVNQHRVGQQCPTLCFVFRFTLPARRVPG